MQQMYQCLTDAQWQALEPLFPKPEKRGRGKPHTPWRSVVNAVLFVLYTKGKWGALPKSDEYASKSAAHRWYLAWKKSGVLEQVLTILKEFHPDREISLPPERAPYNRAMFQQIALQAPAAAAV